MRKMPTVRLAECSLAASLVLLSSTGCGLRDWTRNGFKVGPEYCRPVEPVASEWIENSDPRVSSAPPQLDTWWMTFNDPVLNDLVQSGSLQNLTLREAGARILEARYQRRFAAGNLFPQLQEAFGVYSRNQISRNTAFVPPEIFFSQWDTGFNVSWELDFWGRYRRAIEAADANLDAAVENYDDALVLLVSDVAAAYAELRTFQQRLAYARANVESQEKSLAITEDKLRNGATTERDVQMARTVLEQTRSAVPVFETGVRVSNNQLCVLLGIPPQDLTPRLGAAPIPTAAPEIAVGIPADLVRRRPDVRRAERELAAQSARIGVAQSDLYPHLGLNGTIGASAEQFNDLFDGSRSTVAGIGPFFRWDLLNYGRIASNIGIQDARFQQLAWAYQQRVLNAGREAEDAIISYLKSQERVRAAAASAQAAARALEITQEQYRQGVVDFTAVFIASSEQSLRQDLLADAQGGMAQSLISLYRALGGGWEIRLHSTPAEEVPPAPVPQPAGEIPPAAPDQNPPAPM
jgi:NodT family efflux transporter outer membrane factor (OMF) lipoprotein